MLLLLCGILIGALEKEVGGMGSFTSHWTLLDPHLLLFIFLPPLIYEGTIAVDFHVFKTSFYQMALLAGPGVLISMGCTALVAKYVFNYGWDWYTALTFGAMFSATDPVAVVSLLKELGASKHLAILIEGESLFNDGTGTWMLSC